MVEQTAEGEGRPVRTAPMAYADAAGLDGVRPRGRAGRECQALGAFEVSGSADMDARREVLEEIEGPPRWLSDSDRFLRLSRVMGEVAREVAGVPAGRPVDAVTLRSQLVELGARVLSWVDWLDEQEARAALQARLSLGGES